MIREIIQSISGYPGLFLACALSGLVVPLPEDFPLIFAGMRVAEGTWSWAMVLWVSTIGVAVRDVLAWGLGRTVGDTLLRAGWLRRLLGPAKVDRAVSLVRTRGASAVLLGRFLIGFRAPVFMVAGATGVPLRAFVVYDTIGLLVVVPLTVIAGFWFGEPLADGIFWALQRTRVVVGAIVAALVIWGLWRVVRSERPPPGSDTPDPGES